MLSQLGKGAQVEDGLTSLCCSLPCLLKPCGARRPYMARSDLFWASSSRRLLTAAVSTQTPKSCCVERWPMLSHVSHKARRFGYEASNAMQVEAYVDRRQQEGLGFRVYPTPK